MKITIDTNIFHQDFNLKTSQFKIFLECLDTIPATLYISNVVIDETVNKYQETLKKKVSELSKLKSTLRKSLGIEVDMNFPNVSDDSEKYRNDLISKLKAAKTEFLKYPETPHQKIIKRIFERKLPFRGGESGYRDFLIWESIRKLVLWGHEQVIFLTNNTSDFGTGSHISEEYQDKFSRPENFRIITSISQFNEEFITPKLKKLDSLKEKLQKNKIKNFDFKDWINDRLVDLLRDIELEDVLLGFPLGAGSIWVSEILIIHDFDIHSVREIRAGEKLVRFEISLKVAVSVDIDWEDYIRYEEVREYLGESSEEFSSSMGYSDVDIVVNGYLVLDGENKVTNEDVTKIDGPYDSYEIEY